jgi:hypothetical protein
LNLPMFEFPFLNGSMCVCMLPFFLPSFNLIFHFSQSLYVFYIESLQKLDIIVMPLCEKDTWAQWFNVCVWQCVSFTWSLPFILSLLFQSSSLSKF